MKMPDLFKAALLLLATGLLATCVPDPNAMTSETDFTYLALGDSYTIGESVAENERFPIQLAERLRAEGVAIGDPEIIARTGWTTGELIAAVERGTYRESYDLVTLLVGVNDQFRGYPLDGYRREFAQMLDTAIQFAGGDASRVLVLSIPDWGVTPFGADYDAARVANEIDAFNAVNRELAEAAGVAYFDITAISRQAASDPSLVAGDGLHPSGEMYSLWVDQLFDYALSVVGDSN